MLFQWGKEHSCCMGNGGMGDNLWHRYHPSPEAFLHMPTHQWWTQKLGIIHQKWHQLSCTEYPSPNLKKAKGKEEEDKNDTSSMVSEIHQPLPREYPPPLLLSLFLWLTITFYPPHPITEEVRISDVQYRYHTLLFNPTQQSWVKYI